MLPNSSYHVAKLSDQAESVGIWQPRRYARIGTFTAPNQVVCISTGFIRL
jgi:hypothetical protein